ncbi:MAG: helix-turn-helix domain-containing protein [Halobacteriales archaeon]|nr:helix-turn-helix domain-containing protein [Halobacteriales archaeon]
MVVQAALRVQHEGCVSESFTGGVWLVQVSSDRGHDLYVLHAPDAARLDRARRDIERYVGAPVEPVHQAPTMLVYKHHNPPSGPIGVIRRSGCILLWPAVWRDGVESFTVMAGTRAQVAHLLPQLAALGSASVERISELPPEGVGRHAPLADLAGGLTPRQLGVLRAAVERGYYASPRRVSSAELARSFGIGPSTLKEHLRKAEAAVLHRLGALLDEQPGLERAAQRGPGRPRRR